MNDSFLLKHLEDKNKELQQRLDCLQKLDDHNFDWDLLWDNKGNLVHSSAGIEKITGYNLDVLGCDNSLFNNIVHPGDLKLVNQQIEASQNGATINPFSFRIIKADKRIAHVEFLPLVITNNNVFQGLKACIRDISDRMELKNALKKYRIRNTLLQKILNTAHVAFTILDSNFRYTKFNHQWMDFLGYSKEELMALTNLDVTYPDDIIPTINGINKIHQGIEQYISFEKRYIKKDGSVIWGELSITALKNGTDEKSSYIGVITDITKRKVNELEILKLSTALTQSPVSIIITDGDGNIEYANPFFTQLTGYKSDEILGQNPRILKTNRYTDKFYQALWITIKAGKVWHGEFHNKKKDGTIYIEDATIAPIINQENKITNYVAVKRDITKQKQIKQDLIRQKKELLELNWVKDKFLSIISHDLQNPFNVLMGLSKLLILNYDDYTKPEKEEMLNAIFSTSQNTYFLLENLLAWAHSQSGKLKLYKEHISLKQVANNVISLVKGGALNKRIVLECNVPEGLSIFADANMVELVIRNLLTNAIKFTGENGTVKLSASQENQNIVIVVEDTGIGMDDSTRMSIFSMAGRRSNPGTNNEQGTGLGLIFCKEFIEKHNGQIHVESTLGVGTKFKITLPLHTSE
ncbi:MAG: PAS domain S-box protein [Breznakibacter sp.]